MTPLLNFGVSLRTRLTLWYGALLALTLLAFSTLLYFTLQQSLAKSVDDRLTLRADQIQREVGPSIGGLLQPEDVAPDQLESTIGEFVQPGIYVQVITARGAVVAAPPNLAGGELPVPDSSRQAMAEDRRIFDKVPVAKGGASVRLLTVPIHQPGATDVAGAVQVGESLAPLDSTMAAVAGLMLSAGVVALVVAVAIGWWFTRSALSPVARITATARHIAATGDYRQRLHVTRPRLGQGDELFFLAGTFNDMIARLEHMLESQRRLLADTSHELRNPITVIRGNLALLRREAVPEHVRREAVLEAEEEAARMGRLVADLLMLARADAGEAPSMRSDQVDLASVVGEVVDQLRPLAGDRRIIFTSDGDCATTGDRDRLKQLVTNLVENAIRYTQSHDEIDVSVTGLQHAGRTIRSPDTADDPSMVVLSVSDTGIGIAPSDLSHVFERFYRADKARSRAHGGTGLGLSIAAYIVQAHGGTIEASSNGSNRGSTFRVRLAHASQPLPDAAQPSEPRVVAASR